jgi:hypothetical protein
VSDVHAYARALGYQDRAELCQALEETRSEPLMTLTRPSGLPARTVRARRKLLAKFGFDLGRASPATLADALYRIAKTLPEEWRAAIVSGEKKRREAEVLADRILKDLDQLSEQEEDPASMSAGQTAPRRPHRGKGVTVTQSRKGVRRRPWTKLVATCRA